MERLQRRITARQEQMKQMGVTEMGLLSALGNPLLYPLFYSFSLCALSFSSLLLPLLPFPPSPLIIFSAEDEMKLTEAEEDMIHQIPFTQEEDDSIIDRYGLLPSISFFFFSPTSLSPPLPLTYTRQQASQDFGGKIQKVERGQSRANSR